MNGAAVFLVGALAWWSEKMLIWLTSYKVETLPHEALSESFDLESRLDVPDVVTGTKDNIGAHNVYYVK